MVSLRSLCSICMKYRSSSSVIPILSLKQSRKEDAGTRGRKESKRKRAQRRDREDNKPQKKTHALTNRLKSPTVCTSVFALHTNRLPSAIRSWTLVVGLDLSTSNTVFTLSLSLPCPLCPPAPCPPAPPCAPPPLPLPPALPLPLECKIDEPGNPPGISPPE